MSDIDPEMPQTDEAMFVEASMAAAASPLARWLAERADRLEAMGQIRDWRPLCRAAMAAGIRNAKDGDITPAVISRVWSRLKHRRRKEGVTARPALPVTRLVGPPTVASGSEPGVPAAARVALVSPPRHVPVERSQAEVDALIRIKGELANLKAN